MSWVVVYCYHHVCGKTSCIRDCVQSSYGPYNTEEEAKEAKKIIEVKERCMEDDSDSDDDIDIVQTLHIVQLKKP